MPSVAIIGAGPGGLVTARWLKREGFEPTVFEQGSRIGGQWASDSAYSGVWPSMRTNTSRIMTAFSDLAHEPGTCVYPTNQEIHDYLERYATKFGLATSLRLKTRVLAIDRNGDTNGWSVVSEDRDGVRREESYSRVVVAVGRFNKPSIPPVEGLASFSGSGGVRHTFDYKCPEKNRGLRVLVAGCSISALEIASDLAMLGAARVVSTHRRQRYVIQKLLAGVPTDHLAFTRFLAMAEECMPKEVMAGGLKEFITRFSGSPEQYGAPKPAANVFEAGITQSQHYLPLVAEGRIQVKPWMTEVDGQTVRFTDGSSDEFDTIILGTGYDLNLPFLSESVRRMLDLDAQHADLYKFTFHPEVPDLAFAGMFDLIGPTFPTLELQARWIAYAWGEHVPLPSREQMEAGIAAYRARRNGPQMIPMHVLAAQFAHEAGVEPQIARWPELARALLFGPMSPMSFRLSGRDSLIDAPRHTEEDAVAFGVVPTSQLTTEQCMQLRALAGARGDVAFSDMVQRLTQ